ncbi:MAG TPA: PPOX class F420-dependent oxidoreductase [Herpetosiphonaceae bacterium]|nr:PPOX class F420-dependent oxidoreductase [Herpetosiphonaceae bacterium]
MVNEITPEVRAFLEEKRFAVLATIRSDGSPQQTVMWYLLADGYVLMNTARGRAKDEYLRRDPRLSICVEDGYRYVTLAGTAEIIDDQEIAQEDIAALAVRYHGPEKGAAQAETFRKQQRMTIHMSIQSVIANGFE